MTGKGERTLPKLNPTLREAAVVVPDLAAAVDYILANSHTPS